MNTQLNAHQRILLVMKEVTTVFKNEKVNITDSKSYKAVSHDDVTFLLHSAMANAGLVLEVTQSTCNISEFETVKSWNGKETKSKNYRADVTVELSITNAETPSDKVKSVWHAYAFDSGDKAIGKATSMAVKTGLLKIFMLESRDAEEERQEVQKPIPISSAIAEPPPVVISDESKRIAGQANSLAPKKGPGPSDGQRRLFYVLVDKCGWTDADMKKYLKNNFGVDSSKDLRVDQVNLVIETLQKTPTLEQALSSACIF